MGTDKRGAFLNVPCNGGIEEFVMSRVVDKADSGTLGRQSQIAHEMVEQLLAQSNETRRSTLTDEDAMKRLMMLRPFVQSVASF